MDYAGSWIPFVQRTSNDLFRVSPTVGDYSRGPLPWQPAESSQVTSQATFANMNQTLFLRINMTQQHELEVPARPESCSSPFCLSVPLWMPGMACICMLTVVGEKGSAAQNSLARGALRPSHASCTLPSAAQPGRFLHTPRGKKTGRSTFSLGLCHSWNVWPCQEQKIITLMYKQQDPKASQQLHYGLTLSGTISPFG